MTPIPTSYRWLLALGLGAGAFWASPWIVTKTQEIVRPFGPALTQGRPHERAILLALLAAQFIPIVTIAGVWYASRVTGQAGGGPQA